ncbi:MAG: hypothetical protein J7J86_02440 [Bacteroidales bacterium]|nr:hypothetical protein [Bacteroidales bacterium]
MKKAIIILCFLGLFSCDYKPRKITSENVLARVYNEYLYESDLKGIIPKGMSVNDSIMFARNYINNWVKQKLLINKAEKNLSEDKKEFTKQLNDYRNSLLIYQYESKLIKQNLDTVVSDTEIEKYFTTHTKDFELKKNIVKTKFIITNKYNTDKKLIKKYIKSDKPEDIEQLEKYCQMNAEQYFLDDEKWLYFNNILKKIPIKTNNKEEYLKRHKYVEKEDSLYYYFVYFKDFKMKNEISPISLQKNNIKNTIINKRKIKLIKDMKNYIFDNALKNKDFEIY